MMGFVLLTNVARHVHMNYYYDTYQLQAILQVGYISVYVYSIATRLYNIRMSVASEYYTQVSQQLDICVAVCFPSGGIVFRTVSPAHGKYHLCVLPLNKCSKVNYIIINFKGLAIENKTIGLHNYMGRSQLTVHITLKIVE